MPSDFESETNDHRKESEQKNLPLTIADDADLPAKLITRLINLWRGIKRGSVMHWLAGYGAVAYVAVHGVEMVSSGLSLPHHVNLIATSLAFLIAPFVITLAWFHGELGFQRFSRRERVIHIALLIFSIGVLIMVTFKAPGSLKNNEIIVLAVMSGGAHYEEIILDSFRRHAQKKIEEEGGKLVWKQPIKGFDLSAETADGKMRGEWEKLINDIRTRYAKSNVDYLVGVGTYASTALKNADLLSKYSTQATPVLEHADLLSKLSAYISNAWKKVKSLLGLSSQVMPEKNIARSKISADGLIFLGVTDPLRTDKREAALVELLKNREENTKIAGVRYGQGGRAYGEYIASLFPKGQKLVFVREIGTTQDEYMAKELKIVFEELKIAFKDYSYEGQLKPEDLSDKSAIYFAWYGFDNLLAKEEHGAKLLLDLKVVPSTCTDENLKNAGIVVSVDDREVGEAGAKLLLSAILDNKIKIGHLDVVDVPFQHWIDWETVNSKKIKLAVSKGKSTCPK